MSGNLNVNGSDDPSYRYKMPRLVGKVEGRGNGIKTVIANCYDLAQSLGRPAAEVTKFFGCELGAQTKVDEKNDRYIVNGAFETSDLQKMLFKYIEKFVLCPSCGNPETVASVKGKKKSALVFLTCKACGAVGEADNTHKLCTFIIKEIGTKSKASKKDGEDKKSKKKDKDKDKKKKKSEKKEKKKREKAAAAAAGEDGNSSEDDPAATLDSMTIDDTAAVEQCVSRLREYLKSEPKDGDIVTEVENLQRNTGLPVSARVKTMYMATVMEDPVVAINKYANVFSSLAFGSLNGQVDILRAMEDAIATASDGPVCDKLITATPLILNALYDKDVLEEETIIAWYNEDGGFTNSMLTDEHRAVVKQNAQPIVEWLQAADSDDEEDSDDETPEGE